MADPIYRLVFEGKTLPEHDLATVKNRLAQVFKKDAHTIEKMFSGKKIPLKQGLSNEKAQQYQAKMQALGVLCTIELQSQPARPVAGSTVVPPVAPALFKAAPPQAELDGAGHVFPTSSTVVPANQTQTTQVPLKFIDVDKAFADETFAVNLPWRYKIGLIAVGVTMVLLPIIYLGFIASIGYGVISHSIEHFSWIRSLGKLGIVAYLTPIVVGLTVALFMLKPLFARSSASAKTITLDSAQEPVFFHFVNKIASLVGAPRPKQINIDCQVNASASFRKGLFSFVGDDLVLTIGMPLLAGFNAKQLAGVLAHEFGHFAQGAGMRFHYLTHKVNSWFFSAVYLRDSWDERLELESDQANGWVAVILNVARAGVWLTRQLLRGFMLAGHAVSSYMLRQMEFDADRYEALLSGSQQFRDTSLQLQKLGLAFQISHDQLARAWEEKKLVSDFPQLVVRNARQLPDELDHALLSQIENIKTQVYDSHPSDKERIENAMHLQANGIFTLDRDSRDLFKHFESLSKRISNLYYAHELGLEFDASKLVDVKEVVQINKENEKQQQAYHVYFKEMAPVFEFPVTVNIFDTSRLRWEDLLQQYQQVNDKIIAQIGPRQKYMKFAEETFARYQRLITLDLLKQAGFVMYPEWFDMDEQNFVKYQEHLAASERDWIQTKTQLEQLFQLNDERLSVALTLLNHPQLLEANPEHAAQLKTRNRLSLLVNNIKRNTDTITDFAMKHFRLVSLISCAQLIGQKAPEFPAVSERLLGDLKQAHETLLQALGRLDYPFVAEGEQKTIAEVLEVLLPRRNGYSSDMQYYLACGDVMVEKLDAFYVRVLSGLAHVALSVDKYLAVIQSRSSVAAEGMQLQPRQVALAVGAESYTSQKANFYIDEQDHGDSQQPEANNKLSQPELENAVNTTDESSDFSPEPLAITPVDVVPAVADSAKPTINPGGLSDAHAGHRSIFKIDDPSQTAEEKNAADVQADVTAAQQVKHHEQSVTVAAASVMNPETSGTHKTTSAPSYERDWNGGDPGAHQLPESEILSIELVSSALGPDVPPDVFSQFEDKPVNASLTLFQTKSETKPDTKPESALTLEPRDEDNAQ